jgi:hypothetical protein
MSPARKLKVGPRVRAKQPQFQSSLMCKDAAVTIPLVLQPSLGQHCTDGRANSNSQQRRQLLRCPGGSNVTTFPAYAKASSRAGGLHVQIIANQHNKERQQDTEQPPLSPPGINSDPTLKQQVGTSGCMHSHGSGSKDCDKQTPWHPSSSVNGGGDGQPQIKFLNDGSSPPALEAFSVSGDQSSAGAQERGGCQSSGPRPSCLKRAPERPQASSCEVHAGTGQLKAKYSPIHLYCSDVKLENGPRQPGVPEHTYVHWCGRKARINQQPEDNLPQPNHALSMPLAHSMAQPLELPLKFDQHSKASIMAPAIQRECSLHLLKVDHMPRAPRIHSTCDVGACKTGAGPVQHTEDKMPWLDNTSAGVGLPNAVTSSHLQQSITEQVSRCQAHQKQQPNLGNQSSPCTSGLQSNSSGTKSYKATCRSQLDQSYPLLSLPSSNNEPPNVSTGTRAQGELLHMGNGLTRPIAGHEPTRRHSTGSSLHNNVQSSAPKMLANSQSTYVDRASVVPLSPQSARRHSIASFVTSFKGSGGEQLKQLPIMHAAMLSVQQHSICTQDQEVRREQLQNTLTIGQVRHDLL